MLTQMGGRTSRALRRAAFVCALVIPLSARASFARSPAEPMSSEQTPEPAKRPLASAIDVEPGATCLDHGQLVVQVESWLNVQTLDPRIRVDVLGDPARPDAARFAVTVDGRVVAERRWDAAPKKCLDLHAVVGLAVAMALEAAVVESAAAPQPTIKPEPEPDPTSALPAPAPAPAPPPPSRVGPADRPTPPPTGRDPRTSVALLLHGHLLLAPTIGVAGGGQLLLELGWVPWNRLRLGGLAEFWPTTELHTGAYALTGLAGRVDTCFGGNIWKVRPNFCAGVTLGSLRATGVGFVTDNQTVVLPWISTVFGVGARIPVNRRFAFDISLEALIGLGTVNFDVINEDGVIIATEQFDPIGVLIGLGGAFALQRTRETRKTPATGRTNTARSR